MKKIIRNLIILSICTFAFLCACETVDFGDINQNPNGPTTPVTSQLLTNAETYISDIIGQRSGTQGTLYTQQLTEGQYPGLSRYGTPTESYDYWYINPLKDLDEIINLNTNPETKDLVKTYGDNDNQIAVARILRAYFFQYMTDKWGGLPLYEAFKGIDNPNPKFETQEEIYNFIFNELDESIAMMKMGEPAPKGDIILDGNLSRWKTFANSMKIIASLRISDVDPAKAKIKFEEAANSGSIITSNAENILFNYGTDANSDNPWYGRFNVDKREDYIVSTTMIESLRTNLDPRLFKYAQKTRDSIFPSPVFSGGIDKEYVGGPNGKVNGNVPKYSLPAASVLNTADFKIPIFTASQMKFSLAEAKAKGWNVGSGTVESLFKEAIELSMQFWGVDQSDINSYIAAHPYGNIKDIAYEKWVSFFMLHPSESWAEWRRLDWPALTPSSNGAEPSIPVRDAYSSAIIDNNKENYNAIIQSQGPDELTTKLWWDVN